MRIIIEPTHRITAKAFRRDNTYEVLGCFPGIENHCSRMQSRCLPRCSHRCPGIRNRLNYPYPSWNTNLHRREQRSEAKSLGEWWSLTGTVSYPQRMLVVAAHWSPTLLTLNGVLFSHAMLSDKWVETSALAML